MRYLLAICIIFLFSNDLLSQDSLKFESELNIDVKGKHVLTHFTKNPVECIDCPGGLIFDNPFNHFAIYSNIRYSGVLNDKYTVDLGMVLEERSFSGGNTTLQNLQIIPRITISVTDSVDIGNRHLVFKGKGGDFWNEDFDDILRIYNLDFNALKLRLGLGKFWLGFDAIGDLSKSIGLDFHEMYKISGTYEGKRIRSVIALEVNELFDSPRGTHPDRRDYNLSYYMGYGLNESVVLKAHASIRTNSLKSSLALGARLEHEIDNLKVKVWMKFYQSGFNDGYGNGNVSFTDGSSFVGDQIYPLKNYYREVNQWALLSQYQGQPVSNIEVIIDYQKKLYRKLYFLSEIDFNIISNSSRDADYYPVYNTGMTIRFEKEFEFILGITNRHMNLYSFFQRIEASKLPFLSYGFKMNLDRIKLGTKYL